MGNQQSYLNIEQSWELFDTKQPLFEQVRSVGFKNDPDIGALNIWKSKKQQNRFFSKTRYGSTQEDKEVLLRDHQRQCSLNHSNLLKYYGSQYEERYEITVNSLEWHSLFEYPLQTLRNIIDYQANTMSLMSEQTMRGIITDIASVLGYLQSSGLNHSDLRPSTIFIDSQTKACKIIGQGVMFRHQSGYMGVLNSNDKAYLSPEQMRELYMRNPQPQTNPYADDIYSLGMTILEALSQKSLKNIFIIIQTGSFDYYNYEKCTINEELIKERIDQYLLGNYSEELINLLIQMLKRNAQSRPQASDILRIVRQINPSRILDRQSKLSRRVGFIEDQSRSARREYPSRIQEISQQKSRSQAPTVSHNIIQTQLQLPIFQSTYYQPSQLPSQLPSQFNQYRTMVNSPTNMVGNPKNTSPINNGYKPIYQVTPKVQSRNAQQMFVPTSPIDQQNRQRSFYSNVSMYQPNQTQTTLHRTPSRMLPFQVDQESSKNKFIHHESLLKIQSLLERADLALMNSRALTNDFTV